MGLKTIVAKELAMRGKSWTKHAPQAAPNKQAAKALAARQRGYNTLDRSGDKAARYTMPGSYQI